MQRCPGMDPSYFKPDDIKEHKCISCGNEIEFWKDDIKIVCKKCGQTNFNPNLGDTCIVWCRSASDCIGSNDIKEWIRNKRSGNR